MPPLCVLVIDGREKSVRGRLQTSSPSSPSSSPSLPPWTPFDICISAQGFISPICSDNNASKSGVWRCHFLYFFRSLASSWQRPLVRGQQPATIAKPLQLTHMPRLLPLPRPLCVLWRSIERQASSVKRQGFEHGHRPPALPCPLP